AVVTLLGILTFPLFKTIIESFDGSPPFFRRLGMSYRDPIHYLRGAVVGLGLGYGIVAALAQAATPERAWVGVAVGVAAYAGVSLLRDYLHGLRDQGRPQSWRVYVVQGLLGGFVGAAIGFYLDAPQVAAVWDKFQRYLAAGTAPEVFRVTPLLSKWGTIE